MVIWPESDASKSHELRASGTLRKKAVNEAPQEEGGRPTRPLNGEACKRQDPLTAERRYGAGRPRRAALAGLAGRGIAGGVPRWELARII